MTLAEFFSEFETTASLPPGTVQGQERLDSIGRWDSFAVVEFMSMADEKLGVQLEAGANSRLPSGQRSGGSLRIQAVARQSGPGAS